MLDARTLEAMRHLAILAYFKLTDPMCAVAVSRSIETVEDFLAAHDSARDAERDEALAKVMSDAFYEHNNSGERWIVAARAARRHIAEEQGQ
jgi:hypothetical protein